MAGVSRALILHGEPSLAYYAGERPAGVALAYPRLIELGEIRHELRTAGGETPSGSATLDTADGGTLDELAALAPLCEASLWVDGREVLRGQVVAVQIGATSRVEVEV